MPIKEKLANRISRPLTAEMYENYPGFRAGSSFRYSPKSLPRWLLSARQIFCRPRFVVVFLYFGLDFRKLAIHHKYGIE